MTGSTYAVLAWRMKYSERSKSSRRIAQGLLITSVLWDIAWEGVSLYFRTLHDLQWRVDCFDTTVIARYIIALLHHRNSSFFVAHQPTTFATFATPHVGVLKYRRRFWQWVAVKAGHRLLGRTGDQLYAWDRYSSLDERPLLEVMSESGKTSFSDDLQRVLAEVFVSGRGDLHTGT